MNLSDARPGVKPGAWRSPAVQRSLRSVHRQERCVPSMRESPRGSRGLSWSTSSVSRVLFRSEVALDAAAYHSSRTTVTGRLEQPTRGLGRAVLCRLLSETARPPTRPCSRWGLPRRRRYRRRGGLLPRRFTLTWRAEAGQAVCSLLHFPWRSRHRALPGIVLCGARTFLPFRCPSSRKDSKPAIACTASTRGAWGRARFYASVQRMTYERARSVPNGARTNASAVTKGTTTMP